MSFLLERIATQKMGLILKRKFPELKVPTFPRTSEAVKTSRRKGATMIAISRKILKKVLNMNRPTRVI